jgi:ketosteroid isomerase-like protein
VAAVYLPATAQSQRSPDEDTRKILALENAWNQAELNQEPQSMSLLLADTFAYTDDDGTFESKTEWLARMKKAADQYAELTNTGMAVHLYGDTAVVTGQYHERIKFAGKFVPRTGRFTDTWILQSGQWKCVASQSTLIGP